MFPFHMRDFPRALVGAFLLLLLSLLTLAACGTTFQATTASSGPVQVVAAENFWGSIAAQVGGSHVHVTSIIVDPNADPPATSRPRPTGGQSLMLSMSSSTALAMIPGPISSCKPIR